ncbi:MAG: ABC transporter ATP-binding protein [Promicromonosporaceae bacterium]|nr:ABC transporter ATP-binding protein [Promicromonosporaceae bacterium]
MRGRGIRVIRGGSTIIESLDLDVPTGQVVGLLGPSGSGKTTLMRSIVGVQENVSGTLEVLGLPAGSPALRPRVGYVTQAASVYVDLTVTENLVYFAALAGLRGAAAHAAVAEAVAAVDLGGHERQQVESLSGGERSRVSLAAALVGDPELLVLDEPTFGQDARTWRELVALLDELLASGHAVVAVTHDEAFARVLADDALRLGAPLPSAARKGAAE